MSAQINLYHPRFLRQRDPLSLGNLVIATAVLYAALALAGGWASREAARRGQSALAVDSQLKAAKAQMTVETEAAKARKPSPQVLAELERTEALLRRRSEIAQLLESGIIGSTGGFAGYLRGFARQAPEGLWLTSFNIGAGGSDMEIRGSLLNPAALPEYIRRLGTEPAFQGRNFASLSMEREAPPVPARPAAAGTAAVAPAPTSLPRAIDFVLLPKRVEAPAATEVKQ